MFTARNYPYLSGSTMALLTGYKDYDTLDSIQEAFVAFMRLHVDKFETWSDGWLVFWPQYRHYIDIENWMVDTIVFVDDFEINILS